MVGEDRVIMSVKELRRVPVIRQAMERKITQRKAGQLVGLTTRQVRRLIKRVEQEGDPGLAHRGRGTPSNRRMSEPVTATVLRLCTQQYGDFGPTLAAETLAERHGITISEETLRLWLRDKGIDHVQRRPRRTGRGGSGSPMWGSCSSWMAHTMTGSRAGAPAVC